MTDEEKNKLTGKARRLANLRPPIAKGERLPGAGRPKGVREFRTVFRDYYQMTTKEIEKALGIKLPSKLRKKDLQSILAETAIKKAMSGDLKALEMMIDRTDGLANQQLDIVNHDSDMIALESLPPELRIEILNEMIEEANDEIKNAKSQK